MVNKITVESLFSDAGKKLQQDFDSLRKSVPHSGLKGTGLERTLIEFLNNKIPQRFEATSGIIIDSKDRVSTQTDIVIYDASSSPVYYQNEEVRILPIETVASVIEVKTCLDKKELADSFKKIASCKELEVQAFNKDDETSGGGLCGIIFAYTSSISIEKIGEHFVEIAKSYDSHLWPNFIVILDKGICNFYINFLGENSGSPFFDFSGGTPNRKSFPFHLQLAIDENKDLVIHKFMQYLFMHLNLFPERNIPLNYFKPKPTKLKVIENYQYNSSGNMNITPKEYLDSTKPADAIIEIRVDNRVEAHLNFSYWQDGAFILLSNGTMPLNVVLMIPLGNDAKEIKYMTTPGGFQITSILNLTKENFLKWKDVLDGPRTNFKARIIKK